MLGDMHVLHRGISEEVESDDNDDRSVVAAVSRDVSQREGLTLRSNGLYNSLLPVQWMDFNFRFPY